eukprot:2965181-Pyramimonas_sp.AAC.1
MDQSYAGAAGDGRGGAGRAREGAQRNHARHRALLQGSPVTALSSKVRACFFTCNVSFLPTATRVPPTAAKQVVLLLLARR